MTTRVSSSLVLLFLLSLILPLTISHTTALTHASTNTIQDVHTIFLPAIARPAEVSWPMVGANPQRTSWTTEEVTGNLRLEWYRPIEAYISQNVQIIASDGLLYVATARGLYALNAANGAVAWRFDTEMPLGNSPTVANGVVYVGGYDKKLHALDAQTGAHLWSFSGARAGYDTNPLVVEGLVIAGNRDGRLYAIGAHGTTNQGRLVWSFQAGGSIHLSAAYANGVVYFAANDNHAYAVRASNGSQVWRSAKLPGDGYHSYWPVIFRDQVIFSAATGYRTGLTPGTGSIQDAAGEGYGQYYYMERDDIFHGLPDNSLLGPAVSGQSWANGKPVLDAGRITEYHEQNPATHSHLYKPWRRVLVVLNQATGTEFTFDSDNDGHRETIPFAMWGTQSGNRYPPIVGPDAILYGSNIWRRGSISQGQVMGWNPATPRYLSVVGGQAAIDEPQAISGGGRVIYRNLCCDRVGSYFGIDANRGSGTLWDYSRPLFSQAPGYDEMWLVENPTDPVRLRGNYGEPNGIYHSHGDQNAIIPYAGRLYVHRSNAVIAFGPGNGPGELPLLTSRPAVDDVQVTAQTLQTLLDTEVSKIIEAGFLRPGYYNSGQFSNYRELASYFENPGDTLYVLARAYPHVSPQLQPGLAAYLQAHYNRYFATGMVARVGWADGAAREAMPIPPEVAAAMAQMGDSTGPGTRWAWQYPPHNFYALWQYAQVFPQQAGPAYNLAKSRLQVPVPDIATTDFFRRWPWQLNAYIAGYTGFLELQSLAGMSGQDAALRTQVTNELNRLKALRVQIFDKDSYWLNNSGSYHLRTLNISRNFIFLYPEVGAHLRAQALPQVQAALAEYETTAPYWFVARYNGVMNEGAMQNLYDYHALFLAKAYVLQEPRAELVKYLDVPAFARGDLFYLQNLIATIEAP